MLALLLSALSLGGCYDPAPPAPYVTPQGTSQPSPPGPSTVTTSRVHLDAPVAATLSPQEEDEWCWAATVSNVFAFHGHPVAQPEVVYQAYGTIADVRSGPYSNTAALLNRSWVDDFGHPFSARVVGVFDAMAGVGTLTNDALRDSLDRNDPIVLGTTQHAMLVVGMTYEESGGHVTNVLSVQVYDPWPGQGFRDLTPAEATPATRGGTLMFLAVVDVSG